MGSTKTTKRKTARPARAAPKAKSRTRVVVTKKSKPKAKIAPKQVVMAIAAPKVVPKVIPKVIERVIEKEKSSLSPLAFAVGDYVVYPTHGVGRVVGIESAEIAGIKLQLYVISFEAEKMTLRVPIEKARGSGLRKISTKDKMQTAMVTLKGRARSKRTMWSRRAQEYEAKINSGDPILIAEVVRDLHRNVGQPDQSYSERQMYEAALDRLANEFALVEKIDKTQAAQRLEAALRAG